ncbi:MAG: transposase [Minisyncoccia bacterium]
MANRKINFASGEYYHLYNRGNSKQKIFHDEQDYWHFISLLYIFNTEDNISISDLKKAANFSLYETETGSQIVSIGSYVLMPNHFHILITQKIEKGISKFMQKVATAYVMYYNQKYSRTGGLFEGRFKSRHLSTDNYLKYIFSYIHLNPIKLIQKDWKENGIKNIDEAKNFLNNYEYSSYKSFIGDKRIQNKILEISDFPKYFPNKKSFTSEIFYWLKYKEDL